MVGRDVQARMTRKMLHPSVDDFAKRRRIPTVLAGSAMALLVLGGVLVTPWGHAQEGLTAFAVVSEAPTNKARVPAKVLIEGAVSEMALLPSDTVMTNPIWRTIEICHAMKLEGSKTGDDFRVQSVRILDASMLPMALQGFAGDCLIKKAVEIAPLVD